MAMRILHSLWGLPCRDDKAKQEVFRWSYALSAMYVRAHSGTMVLYADALGREMLSPILHLYDEVHEVDMTGVDPVFFAAIKALALVSEPVGSVHIDGDVMLKGEKAWQRLQDLMETSEVVAQGFEPERNVYPEIWQFGEWDFGCDVLHRHPVNVGVLGFSSQELRDIYLARYLTAVQAWSGKGLTGVPDLVLEQAWLSAYVRQEGHSMGVMTSGSSWTEISASAREIGFVHLLGPSKYSYLDRLKLRILETAPDIYRLLSDYKG